MTEFDDIVRQRLLSLLAAVVCMHRDLGPVDGVGAGMRLTWAYRRS